MGTNQLFFIPEPDKFHSPAHFFGITGEQREIAEDVRTRTLRVEKN